MNLLDRYVSEVGKYLPRKNRTDIEAEIRSTLEDMLEERKQADGPATEAEIVELLKEYGSPREVAATYKTHQYLIGPRFYPIFEMVIRIVFAVVAGASLIGLGVALTKTGLTGTEFASALGDWFGGLISGLIAAFGNIVLIFAIIERTQVAERFEHEFKDWDPKELDGVRDREEIDLADHIATIIFTFLALVVFNLYPDMFAIRFQIDGTWTTLPILTDAFFRYLPWINVMGLVQIVFSGIMLGQRMWTPVSRIFSILVDFAGMILAVVILRTPAIFGMTPEALKALGAPESVEGLRTLLNALPTLIIVIIVVVTGIKIVKSLLRLFNTGSKPPYLVIK